MAAKAADTAPVVAVTHIRTLLDTATCATEVKLVQLAIKINGIER